MKIAPEVLDVLANSETIGNSLKLTGQLDRKLYVAVNKVLELAGGKWNRAIQSHLFPSDAAEIMDQIVLTGEITDKKKELGYFPTPPEVVARLLELAEVQADHLVLEPSAGQGAIAFELMKISPRVDCVEIDNLNATHLTLAAANNGSVRVRIITADFLTFEEPNPIYDRVVMNPPFGKNVSPKHVLHAFKFLAPKGRLVSVMPSSLAFRTDALNAEVRAKAQSIHPLPENSFAVSGTNVDTVIVVMEKP